MSIKTRDELEQALKTIEHNCIRRGAAVVMNWPKNYPVDYRESERAKLDILALFDALSHPPKESPK